MVRTGVSSTAFSSKASMGFRTEIPPVKRVGDGPAKIPCTPMLVYIGWCMNSFMPGLTSWTPYLCSSNERGRTISGILWKHPLFYRTALKLPSSRTIVVITGNFCARIQMFRPFPVLREVVTLAWNCKPAEGQSGRRRKARLTLECFRISAFIVPVFLGSHTFELRNLDIIVQHSHSTASNSTWVEEDCEDTSLSLWPRTT